MYKCPITYFQDNLVFNRDKSCWAIYKLKGFNYEFLSIEGKIQMNWRLAGFLGRIMSCAQLFIIPVEQDIDAHYERLLQNLDPDDPLYKTARAVNEQTRDYLKNTDASDLEANDYESFLCVKLQSTADEMELLKEAIAYFFKDPVNAFNSWLMLDSRDILRSKVEEYQAMAQRWLDEQGERMELMAASPRETQWLLRRIAYRGMAERNIRIWHEDPDGQKAWQPEADEDPEEKVLHARKQIVNLFEGDITPKDRYLEVKTEEGISYQSFLVLSNVPDDIRNPGMEWIYKLQKRKVKAEICIHFEAMPPDKALKKIGDKQQAIQSQKEHVAEAGASIPMDLSEGAKGGIWLEQEVKDTRDPLLDTTIQFCIASTSLEDMQARVARLRGFYRDWQFAIERPIADQLKLFFNFFPSVSNMVRGYTMPLTTLMAASGIFGATHSVGDNVGAYIGTTAKGMKKVFLDLALACRRNMSAAVSLIGNLGVGKSFNANLLLVLAVLNGAFGLILDPKGERSNWVEELRILKGHINLITIEAGKENRGVLDPYNIYPDDLDAASELAINVCLELCKIPYGSERYIVLKEAVAKLGRETGRKRCLHGLTTLLDEWDVKDGCHEAATGLARLIRAEKDVGMGQLIYGYGEEHTIRLGSRLNIIQLQNLKMPERNKPKAEYTSEEVVSSVVMMVLSQFAKKFALRNQNRAVKKFQVVLVDESWMLGKTQQGKDLYAFLTRMGRSLYTCPMFNGHSVLDIDDEGIRNNITYRFCFRTDEEEEARRMLRYLGLEVSQGNIMVMKSLRNGECMFRDADGSLARLKFDAVFQDFLKAFDTTPKDKEPGLLEKEVV